MKKISFLLVAFATFLMVSCQKSPVDQYLGIIEDANEKFENATSEEEFNEIDKEFTDQINNWNKTYRGYRPTKEEQKKLDAAWDEHYKITNKKSLELDI